MHTKEFVIRQLKALTAWDQHPSAHCILLISLAVITYLYTVYRLCQIKRKNNLLTQSIAAGTKSFETTVHELEESKDIMANQIRFISLLLTSITHDVQSPLHYVSLTASSITDLAVKGQIDKAAQLGLIIADVAKRTSNLLEDMLAYIKIQIYGNAVNFETVYLRELIDSKVKIFEAAAALSGTDIRIQCAPEININSDRHLLSIILHNLLDNACKYTRSGIITIEACINNEGKTELNISNTGIGLSTKMVELINQDTEEVPEINPKEKRTFGLGLFIVKELVRLLQVQINVEQEEKTHFRLVFNRNHQAENA